MKVLERAAMPDGTEIQMEDWHADYPTVFAHNASIGAYPKSKVNFKTTWFPKRGQNFRASFNFKTESDARQAYNDLINGNKTLVDFVELMWDRSRYRAAITGNYDDLPEEERY